MSYHTFELKYQLTYDEKEGIMKDLKNKDKLYVDYYDYRCPTVCEALRKHGIIIKFTKFKRKDFTFHMMYLVVNPRRVMNKNNYIGIFSAKNTDKMLGKVDKLLQKLTSRMPSIDSFKLNRIDFCTNIKMTSQDEVISYIKILQKGYIPKGFYIDTYYDETSKRYRLYSNSVTFSKKSVSVSFYNKYSQLQENEHCKNIEEAKNILRAEIQCKKNKVQQLSKKFDCPTARKFLKHSDDIGKHVFESYIPKFYGKGDIYKLEDTVLKIQASNLKQISKEKMVEFARESAKHKGLQNATDIRWHKPNKYKELIKKFNKINLSPIIIPRRYEYSHFENPLSLVLKWYGNTK